MVENISYISHFWFFNAAKVYGIIPCCNFRQINFSMRARVYDGLTQTCSYFFVYDCKVSTGVRAPASAPVGRVNHLMPPNLGWGSCFPRVFSGPPLPGESHTFYFSPSVTSQSWLQPRIVSKSCKWMQWRYCLWSYIAQMEPCWIEVCLPREEGQNKVKFYYIKWHRDVFIKLMKNVIKEKSCFSPLIIWMPSFFFVSLIFCLLDYFSVVDSTFKEMPLLTPEVLIWYHTQL